MPNWASVRLKPRCYRADRNGNIGEDISRLILGGKVTIDANADIPMTLSATVTDPSEFPAFSYIAPFLTVEWWDPELGDQHIQEQCGLFIVMPPGETHTAAQGIGRIEGKDLTWVLKNRTLAASISFASGTNAVNNIKSILDDSRIERSNFIASSRTMTKKRGYDPDMNRLEVINDFLFRMSFYPLWFDRQGVPSSRPMRRLRGEEPVRTISSRNGDVVNTVTLDTDIERLCNRVTVIRSDADGDPVYLTRTNSRADSPVSTVNLDEIIGKTIEGSNIDSTSEALALANKTLEEGASVLTRLTVETVPDPRFVDIRQLVRLDIRRDDGFVAASGLWWSDAIEIGFTPADGPMKWRLNKLVPFEQEGS